MGRSQRKEALGFMTPFKNTFSLALLLLAGCVTGFRAGAPRGAVGVIAHRGASAYAPENTLAAFQAAIDLKADWFELDCKLTRDGVPVVMHDAELERTTSGDGLVTESTLAELKQLDAGSWFGADFASEPIPSLGEALDLAKDRIGVYLEVKSCADDSALMNRLMHLVEGRSVLTPGLRAQMMQAVAASGTRNLDLTRKCIEEIRARRMQNQVVIQSFSPVVCLVAVCEAPRIRVEFLGGDPEDKPQVWYQYLEFGYLIGVDGFNVDHDALTKERLDALHRGGKTVAVWTVDDELLMRRYARWGVDAIITNKPDVCLRVLKEMGERDRDWRDAQRRTRLPRTSADLDRAI